MIQANPRQLHLLSSRRECIWYIVQHQGKRPASKVRMRCSANL